MDGGEGTTGGSNDTFPNGFAALTNCVPGAWERWSTCGTAALTNCVYHRAYARL